MPFPEFPVIAYFPIKQERIPSIRGPDSYPDTGKEKDQGYLKSRVCGNRRAEPAAGKEPSLF